jgi:hypothetical protein
VALLGAWGFHGRGARCRGGRGGSSLQGQGRVGAWDEVRHYSKEALEVGAHVGHRDEEMVRVQ